MGVYTGQSVVKTFTLRNPATLQASNADQLPVGVLILNGSVTTAPVSITNPATGRYEATVVLPAVAFGSLVELLITATVGGVTDSSVIWQGTNDTAPIPPAASDVVNALLNALVAPYNTPGSVGYDLNLLVAQAQPFATTLSPAPLPSPLLPLSYQDQGYVLGDTPAFTLNALLDGLTWDITSAVVTLYLTTPEKTLLAPLTATVTNGPGGIAVYQAGSGVLNQQGDWTRQWNVQKLGVSMWSDPIGFYVGYGPAFG
jgi:hypothetical protein